VKDLSLSAQRFFASLRMTALFFVILNAVKDLSLSAQRFFASGSE